MTQIINLYIIIIVIKYKIINIIYLYNKSILILCDTKHFYILIASIDLLVKCF